MDDIVLPFIFVKMPSHPRTSSFSSYVNNSDKQNVMLGLAWMTNAWKNNWSKFLDKKIMFCISHSWDIAWHDVFWQAKLKIFCSSITRSKFFSGSANWLFKYVSTIILSTEYVNRFKKCLCRLSSYYNWLLFRTKAFRKYFFSPHRNKYNCSTLWRTCLTLLIIRSHT